MNIQLAAARAALVVLCLGATATVSRAQSVFTPTDARDIGSPALAGSASVSDGVVTIEAAGSGIWEREDQFHFVYQVITGDVDVRARVDSVTAADAWSKAGLMIRGGLTAGAAHGSALVSAQEGIAFHRRTTEEGITSSTHSRESSSHWVRLVRAGTRITAYTSTDGADWTTIASDTIGLGSTAYVGLAVTSRAPGARTTAKVSNVTVAPALPAGQLSTDIGDRPIGGSTSFANGQYTIRAAGAGIWDSADQFHYVYQQVTGDIDVVARVASVSAADKWSKAGVMIRESLSASSRHAMALTSSGNGHAFHRRPEHGMWSEHTGGGQGRSPGWVRLVRTGSRFEAYRSANGKTWTRIGSDIIPMDDTVYVGIAVTSHNVGRRTEAVVDDLRVTEKAPPPNRPPTVRLTSPTDGTELDDQTPLTITVEASDADGSIVSVEFYANSTLLGRVTKAPFSFVLNSILPGDYSLTAVAIDDKGASTASEASAITVKADTQPAPRAVIFSASTDHAALVTKYVLEIYQSGGRRGRPRPHVTSDLGKPPVASNGEITVDRSSLFRALAPGDYIATVTAVGKAGSARSHAVAFTR